MKVVIAIFFFLIIKDALPMGGLRNLPGNPLSSKEMQYVNDIEETAAGINQFSKERGHEDQQKIEEKEIEEIKEEKGRVRETGKRNEMERRKRMPIEKPKIN